MKNLEHVGFIMDGNRRWAKKHGLTIYDGHLAGAQRVEPIVKKAAKKGISHLTFYTLSTENMDRPEDQLENINDVFRYMAKDPVVERLKDSGVKIKILGDYDNEKFPTDVIADLKALEGGGEDNNRMIINFAINYGGRDDIIRSANSAYKEGHTVLTEEVITSHHDTSGQPDPDLIIRTGEAQRLSNFLIWQAAYSELYFTRTLWPDFEPRNFQRALDKYEPENRRYGK